VTDREALEDQRDFLLRSLEDLEREHDAGDVDDVDYAALKDDYTARAARVLRALEPGAPAAAPRRTRLTGRRLVSLAGVVLFAVLAGVLVAQMAGRREAGDTITGDARTTITEKLNKAGRLGSQGDYAEAVALYDEVLADEPDQAEALTYKGWMLFLSGNTGDGLRSLIAGATADPTYPDAQALLAVVLFRNGLMDEAGRALARLDALDPPPDIRALTDPLRAQLEARASTTTVATP
jgi:tetratricopeptide (TPR) repeat protein